jgi:chromosomal replication initiation ATPase DnaA
MSIWQRIEDMPFIKSILLRAEQEIKEATGVDAYLSVTAIEVPGKDGRKQMVKETVCSYYKVTWPEITSTAGDRRVVEARHVYMYIMCRVYGYSRKEVANDCGGRDHSTASASIKKIEGFYKVGDPMVKDIENIKKILPVKVIK